MANISAIKLPNGTTYDLKDNGALQLTGGSVTGHVSFGDSVSMDDLTVGQLVVEGAASITNNLQVNTINGVTVGSSPKFTDTVTTVSVTGSGNAITAASASNGTVTLTKGTTFLTSHNSYSITNSGSGNAVTAVSLSGTTFTVTKGTTFLTSHQTIKQDGVTGATGNHFGTSSTAAATAAKTVSIIAGTPTLETGLRVTVKFTYANTANSPTLNVNSLGAKNIFHNGAQITSGSNKALLAGTVEFVYDGTQWQLVGNYIDTNTTYTWSSLSGKPTATGSSATGITASTTATKTTLGTAFTIPNVTSAGSASTWVFEEISIPNVTAAGSASSWTFEEKSIPNVTSVGSASTWAFTGVTVANSISGAVDADDSTQLNITVGTTTVQSKSSGGNGTAPTLGTAIKVQSKSGGSNGTAPTLGTAIKVQSKKSGANGSAPTLGTAFTVPNVTGNTSATVSITDNGHTHTIS